MAKARQQYFADEVSLFKEARTISFDEDLLQKINDIDTRAQENVIEIVKVNSVPLPVDANKAVDVTVPWVVDRLDSVSGTDSLSAKQWKILYDYILQLQSRWRFLSNWNAATGLPVTEPFWTWYSYNPWDYYVVGVVDLTTNYRPDWATYTSWVASIVVETETIWVWDLYVWDGTQWILSKNSARQIAVDATLSTTSTNPVENRVITTTLNTKQNLLTAWANITIDANNVISAVDTTYPNLPAASWGTDDSLVTTWDKYTWDHKQNQLVAWANIQINGNTISATNTQYGNLPEAQWGTDVTLVTTWDKYNWNHKQDELTAWANITINNWEISATDTTYSAGTWITIDANNVISADVQSAAWWHITWNLNDQTDLKDALDEKQNLLTAGPNIMIVNDIISAVNTTYTAWDWIYFTWTTINNASPFSPENIGQEGQVLKRTLDWYSWQNESWGGGWGWEVDNTPYGPIWNGRTWIAPSQNAVYDKISAMDIIIADKQDKLVAWQNIQINGNVISATDTTYTASDFDIKDLADSTWLRTRWNNKQDAINDLAAIREWAAKWMTALQPGRVDNVSELINDAGYITKSVSDLVNYYTKNETYNKQEIDNLIQNFGGFEVVSVLPTTNIQRNLIYLLWPTGNNNYEEYVYIGNQWVKIGDTQVDLTNYYNKTRDDSDDVTEWSSHLFLTPSDRVNLRNQSGVNTWDETKQSIQTKLWAANSTKSWYLTSADWNTFNNKLDRLIAWNNIQINGDVISATNTTYSAWSGISINGTTINNTKQFSPANSWSSGEVLTKTSSWYRWEPSQWGGWWGAVTSVNNQTWDVIVNEFRPSNNWSTNQVLTKTSNGYAWANPIAPDASNVKLFKLNSFSDYTTATAAYNWFMAWKYPIVCVHTTIHHLSAFASPVEITWDFCFIPRKFSASAWTLQFVLPYSPYDDDDNYAAYWYTQPHENVIEFTTSWGSVSDISQAMHLNASAAFLSTQVDYPNPYTPLYDWSPATKKYVDDKVMGATPVTLTYAQSLSVDMSQSLTYVLTLTWDCDISFTNMVPWQVYQIVVIQDSNGWHRLTLPVSFKYASGYAQDTTANGVSKLILDTVGWNYFASITRYS